MENLKLKVEALIFASIHSISITEIKNSLEAVFNEEVSEENIGEVIGKLKEKFGEGDYSFQLVSIGGGYKFMTRSEFHALVVAHLKNESKTRLTRAAIETLSIIAYKQPVTRTEIEDIRGVNCEYSIHKLLEKDLVEITGRDPGPGRPLIYQTTPRFMDYFGISSLEDLPKMKEFEVSENQVGELAPLEEETNEGIS